MRGRKPCPLTLAPADVPTLQRVARSRCRPFLQVQHARAVLAVAGGERIQTVASGLHCDPSTIWRLCRRYERNGIEQLLVDRPRIGRPQQLSPPPESADRQVGLPGADSRGAAHHSLDKRRPGSPSRLRRNRRLDLPQYGPAGVARCGLATTPYPLLADCPSRSAVQSAGREGVVVLRPGGPFGRGRYLDGCRR